MKLSLKHLCSIILLLHASIYCSDVRGPVNDVAAEIQAFWKAAFAKQFCKAALDQNKPEIAQRIGMYIHGTNWRSEIEKTKYTRPAVIALDGIIKISVIKEMNNQFPDLKDFFDNSCPNRPE